MHSGLELDDGPNKVQFLNNRVLVKRAIDRSIFTGTHRTAEVDIVRVHIKQEEDAEDTNLVR
jgi:hypothetical protein